MNPNVAEKHSTTAFQGRRLSCESPIRVFSPEFTLHAIWRKNVRSGFTPQSTALEGRRTGKICNCDVNIATHGLRKNRLPKNGPPEHRPRETVRRWAAMSALLLAIAAAGCGHDAASTADANREEPPPDPQVLLAEMIDAYERAERYSDRGVLQLRVRQSGRWVENEAPMAVSLQPGRRLSVEAYLTRLTCDGEHLQAHIADPATPGLEQQRLVVAAPAQLRLAEIYNDPVLRVALLGSLGRQPVQLELLLGDRPLQPALAAETTRRYLGTQRVEGRTCHGVAATTADGDFVFWIDAESRLLRRLEYPMAAMLPELGTDDATLVAELRDATFDPPTQSAGAFDLQDDIPDASPVASFVLPPSPLPSELFGQRVADFAFTDPAGGEVTGQSLDGDIAVLLWVNLHPACKVSLEGLAKVRRELQDAPRVRIYAVCTEPTSVSRQEIATLLADSSAGDVPWLRDLAAHGRDVFRIPGAPALVVLDGRGTVQIVEVGVNPRLDEELPVVIDRLRRGDDLARELVGSYQRELAEFRQRLEAVRL